MTANMLETASPIRRAVRIWYAVLGGVGAWTVHLLALSSFVRFSCNVHGYTWVMHAVTVITAIATLVAMWLALRLVREADHETDETADTAAGRLRFLGRVGLLVGAINLALIVLEGAYVTVLKTCA
jgi:hypothetical protein